MTSLAHEPELLQRNPELLEDIETALQARLSGRVFDFHLEMHNGGLVLHGRTHSYYAKQLAQQAVMEAINLPIRANKIEVV